MFSNRRHKPLLSFINFCLKLTLFSPTPSSTRLDSPDSITLLNRLIGRSRLAAPSGRFCFPAAPARATSMVTMATVSWDRRLTKYSDMRQTACDIRTRLKRVRGGGGGGEIFLDFFFHFNLFSLSVVPRRHPRARPRETSEGLSRAQRRWGVRTWAR